MKKTLMISILLLATLCAAAQNAAEARKVLDKAAAIVGRSGGAGASFKISSPKIGTATGTIAIKGKKFHARTPQAIVWFDGKTQWTYLKQTEEVNVTTPTEAQLSAMNPYKFINMYKQGYNLSMTSDAQNHTVRLVAQNKKRAVEEMVIVVGKKTGTPVQVKMKEGSTWTTIDIKSFQAKDQSDKTFVFNAKDYPKAEVIDLR